MDVKFLADTKMADSKRELELQKASFNQQVNSKVSLMPLDTRQRVHLARISVPVCCRCRSQHQGFSQIMSDEPIVFLSGMTSGINFVLCNRQKAEAQLAYELQAAKEQQKIRLEEIEIEVVQRKKQITIEEKEIERTEKELIAIVKRPAEAEAYKMQQLAEGHK